MFAEEWNWDDAIAVRSEEAREEGRAEGRAEGEARGEARGRNEEKSNFALSMLKDKMPVNLIRKYTKLSLKRIKELADSIGVAVVM